MKQEKYGRVVVAAAFSLMFVGFGAAYSFAAFFTAFESEFGASRRRSRSPVRANRALASGLAVAGISGIIGFLYTGAGLGPLLGPWLAGAAYDALGAYDVPIAAGALAAFLAAACILILIQSEKARARHSR